MQTLSASACIFFRSTCAQNKRSLLCAKTGEAGCAAVPGTQWICVFVYEPRKDCNFIAGGGAILHWANKKTSGEREEKRKVFFFMLPIQCRVRSVCVPIMHLNAAAAARGHKRRAVSCCPCAKNTHKTLSACSGKIIQQCSLLRKNCPVICFQRAHQHLLYFHQGEISRRMYLIPFPCANYGIYKVNI